MTNELPLSLEEEVKILKKQMAALYANGMDRFAQEGYLQIGTNNKPGSVRFDGKSIQIAGGDTSTDYGAITFVPYMQVEPLGSNLTSDPPKAYITGRATTSGYTRIRMGALDTDPPSADLAFASVTVETPGDSHRGEATLAVILDDTPTEYSTASLLHIGGTDAGAFRLLGAFLQFRADVQPLADPSNATEGAIWYNATDNQFKFYEGSTIKTLGGGGVGIISNARDWQDGFGYEFWLIAGADLATTAAAANPSGLSGWGWTFTSIGVTEGSAADFNSTSDRDPTRFVLNASGDLIYSPRRFGSAEDFVLAGRALGSTPTKLCFETWARFTTVANNENATGFGFAPSGALTAKSAVIYSNGTNFIAESNANTDTGAAVDTSWHLWRMEVGSSTTEWFIDDVSQGTLTTNLADIWPVGFVCVASTNNRIDLAWARVYYE